MPRLDPAECRRRLAAARHAYLATASGDGRPHVVPVTFAVVGREGTAGADGGWDVVSAVDHKPKAGGDARRLRRLRNLADNPRAAVLADAYDDDWDRLWWVRADGSATVEDVVAPSGADGEGGAAATRAALEALADRYPQYRERPPAGPVVRVRVARWTGWEAAATGAAGATPAAR
ncbi:hypothetical protein GCM10009809_34580 [Isoptericola hypogeus]|uniref:Pyridoxamine 5'-phosphate oxidase N-terminal domain-containing protein n=1 Tax=Isoptericola hypogeus TaxID=300179 RepID=A0ABN2JRD3_9MICO